MWWGADRPREPSAVTLQDVLPVVAKHQLATITHTVDLGAPVLVEVPRVAGRRAGHVLWWPRSPTTRYPILAWLARLA